LQPYNLITSIDFSFNLLLSNYVFGFLVIGAVFSMLLNSKGVLRHVNQNPQLLILILPFFIYYIAKEYARVNFYRDPTSQYFDPSRAYDRMYTETRIAQADAFVNTSATHTFKRTSSAPPYLCIGMLTVARPAGVVYFRQSIGSLLDGLTQEERNGIYLMPFITHTDPTKHPVYPEPWLRNVVDRILMYNESARLTEEQFIHVKELEAERDRTGQPDREKHMFDYGLLMKECMDTNATYVAIMEDDVLAIDGWYHRTRAALKDIERKEARKGLKDCKSNITLLETSPIRELISSVFYLRLFYTERLLSWDESEYKSLLRWALFLGILTPISTFLVLRKTSLVRKHGYLIFAFVNISIFLFAYFFFTSGPVSMLPMSHGTHEMPKHGCCAQGIIYPKTKIPMLTKWYEENRIGFVDTLAEKLADTRGDETGTRWAITPSVLQHFGSKSSKGDNWGSDKPGEMSEAEKLWNFEFELNDAKKLRKEHEKQAWRDTNK
jgi:hypothetical protein